MRIHTHTHTHTYTHTLTSQRCEPDPYFALLLKWVHTIIASLRAAKLANMYAPVLMLAITYPCFCCWAGHFLAKREWHGRFIKPIVISPLPAHVPALLLQSWRLSQADGHEGVWRITRVGQNHIYTPYMTVYLVVFLPKYRIYTVYIYGSGQLYVLQWTRTSWVMVAYLAALLLLIQRLLLLLLLLLLGMTIK